MMNASKPGFCITIDPASTRDTCWIEGCWIVSIFPSGPGIWIGSRSIHWRDIYRVEPTAWWCPLIVKLILFDKKAELLIYPGDPESCRELLRDLQCASCQPFIDESASVDTSDPAMHGHSESGQ